MLSAKNGNKIGQEMCVSVSNIRLIFTVHTGRSDRSPSSDPPQSLQ